MGKLCQAFFLRHKIPPFYLCVLFILSYLPAKGKEEKNPVRGKAGYAIIRKTIIKKKHHPTIFAMYKGVRL